VALILLHEIPQYCNIYFRNHTLPNVHACLPLCAPSACNKCYKITTMQMEDVIGLTSFRWPFNLYIPFAFNLTFNINKSKTEILYNVDYVPQYGGLTLATNGQRQERYRHKLLRLSCIQVIINSCKHRNCNFSLHHTVSTELYKK
jgi:hypothetical protein